MTSADSPPPSPVFPPDGLRLSESLIPADAPDDPDVAVVRRFLTALDDRDRVTARSQLAEEVSWIVPGRSVVAGIHRGPDAVLDVDDTLRRLSDGTLRHHVLVWLAAPPHAHAVTRQSATRHGREASFDLAFVFTRDNVMISGIHAYTDDLYAFEAFWQ